MFASRHGGIYKILTPGDFLRIYNLRAIPGSSSKVPGLTGSQSEEADHLAFHLHGGTAFGRGIRVLPDDSADVQELRRNIAVFPPDDELHDSDMLESWSTPPESPSRTDRGVTGPSEASSSASERSCDHDAPPASLAELKRSEPGRTHHARVQLRSYEPRRLHQALKLYCSKCSSLRDVPDDELVSGVFSEACGGAGPCRDPPPWAVSGRVDLPGAPSRPLTVHLSTQLISEGKTKQLVFLEGPSLEETCRLAPAYLNVVPVRSSGGHLTLLDLSAPFLFRGRKRYYGCRRCSEVAFREPCGEGLELIDEKVVAEALGVQLLQFVLLMKLELQDATGTLDVFLWRDAELFFKVSAEDVASNQEAQSSVCQTMDSLCPPGGSTGERPWLDVCLAAYQPSDDEGQTQTCYQICHTSVTRPRTTRSDPA